MTPTNILFAIQLEDFQTLLKFDWSFKITPSPHTHLVGSMSPEKRGVCHCPIKNYSYHLFLSTAIVTADTCVNVTLTKFS